MGVKPGLPGPRKPLSPACSGPTMLSLQDCTGGGLRTQVAPVRSGRSFPRTGPLRADASSPSRRSQVMPDKACPQPRPSSGTHACHPALETLPAALGVGGTAPWLQATCVHGTVIHTSYPDEPDAGSGRWADLHLPAIPAEKRAGGRAHMWGPCLPSNIRSLSRFKATQHHGGPRDSRYS